MSLRQKLASDVSAAARAKLAEAGSDSGNPYIGLMTKLLTNRVPVTDTYTASSTTQPRRQASATYDMPATDFAPMLNPMTWLMHNINNGNIRL